MFQQSFFVRFPRRISILAKAKALLGESNVHLHNEFLFAILVKCQTGAVTQGNVTIVVRT